jgi:hypothetical protein
MFSQKTNGRIVGGVVFWGVGRAGRADDDGDRSRTTPRGDTNTEPAIRALSFVDSAFADGVNDAFRDSADLKPSEAADDKFEISLASHLSKTIVKCKNASTC